MELLCVLSEFVIYRWGKIWLRDQDNWKEFWKKKLGVFFLFRDHLFPDSSVLQECKTVVVSDNGLLLLRTDRKRNERFFSCRFAVFFFPCRFAGFFFPLHICNLIIFHLMHGHISRFRIFARPKFAELALFFEKNPRKIHLASQMQKNLVVLVIFESIPVGRSGPYFMVL